MKEITSTYEIIFFNILKYHMLGKFEITFYILDIFEKCDYNFKKLIFNFRFFFVIKRS